MPVTIHHIAKATGFSASTVSRALNDKPNISEKTKRHVHSVAQKLGYRPNRIARSLATNKTGVIGLVMPSANYPEHTLFYLMLEIIYQEIQKIGYTLSFFMIDMNSQDKDAALSKLEGYQVDGLILVWLKERYISEAHLVELSQKDIPFIVIGDRLLSCKSINLIACDNYMGSYKATKHLISLGHEKIAVICDSCGDLITSHRLSGYNAALDQAGISYPEEFRKVAIHKTDFNKQGGGETAMNYLLDNAKGLTAVFVFADAFAAEAIRAIQKRGYRVPDDYAVMGFDGIEYGSLLNPGLTTVRQPYEEMGIKAIQMLKQLMDNGKLMKNRILVKPELIIRESCGLKKNR
jgi:LacI family transcriptional regulator